MQLKRMADKGALTKVGCVRVAGGVAGQCNMQVQPACGEALAQCNCALLSWLHTCC